MSGRAAGARVSRRTLLVGAGGLAVGAAATEAGTLATASGPSKQITVGEDLMREHGVLKRVLLVYRAALDRIAAGTAVPPSAVHGGAMVIHDYIEGFHEGLEEAYVFPALRTADMLVDTVDTLLVQHARGRTLTMRILDTTSAAALTPAATRQLDTDLAAFVRMYEPHEAREDTVVFPTLRDVLGAQRLHDLATTFATLEDQQFGAGAFATMVATVATLEQTLGIADLNAFTPSV